MINYRSPHSGTLDSDAPGMLHAQPVLHDDDSRSAATAAAVDVDVETTVSASVDIPLHVDFAPPSVATQSAVYEEPGSDGRPVYRGFKDPKSQSLSFKRLQSLIESGEGKRIVNENHFYTTSLEPNQTNRYGELKILAKT